MKVSATLRATLPVSYRTSLNFGNIAKCVWYIHSVKSGTFALAAVPVVHIRCSFGSENGYEHYQRMLHHYAMLFTLLAIGQTHLNLVSAKVSLYLWFCSYSFTDWIFKNSRQCRVLMTLEFWLWGINTLVWVNYLQFVLEQHQVWCTSPSEVPVLWDTFPTHTSVGDQGLLDFCKRLKHMTMNIKSVVIRYIQSVNEAAICCDRMKLHNAAIRIMCQTKLSSEVMEQQVQ